MAVTRGRLGMFVSEGGWAFFCWRRASATPMYWLGSQRGSWRLVVRRWKG